MATAQEVGGFYPQMKYVLLLAAQSPDPSTQNAACLTYGGDDLFALAVNDFPNDVVKSPERWERPTKYHFVEHAERNVIYQAARSGLITRGATMVAVWASCHDCARAIIQAGITTVVRYKSPHHNSHWDDSIESAEQMFAEANIRVITLDQPIDDIPPILRNGELWTPSV